MRAKNNHDHYGYKSVNTKVIEVSFFLFIAAGHFPSGLGVIK